MRSLEDSDLEEIMSAVTRAWAIPSVNVYGFFLTMTKKMSGRQMMAWIARLWGKSTKLDLERNRSTPRHYNHKTIKSAFSLVSFLKTL